MSQHEESTAAHVDALVVGEALVDEIVTNAQMVSHPGGSPYNVAVGLARLGRQTLLHTTIGDDDRGALLRERASASGVALSVESLTAEPTSFARATIDGTGAALYDFTVTWRPTPFHSVASPRIVHVGSIGAAMAPGRDLVAGVVSALAPTSIISLDPNVRPQLTADRDETRWRLEELVTLSDVVKVSDEDLQWLHPGRETSQIAADWLARGPDLVVVTRGRLGAIGYSQWGVHHSAPTITRVADTIGAGDSFTAGLLSALLSAGVTAPGERLARLDGAQISRSIDFATMCAAITVSRSGAQPPWEHEVA
ncbi:carbohydrate kinase [Microbacterium sp. SS28]|uniref:carbohydrate kinase family protein n=1 Tax=Microbacterium sp. SS28 TaxID=2919948 RepID=UPI001FAAEEE3|nr:carbohydrate kinase [Microbacterium sp. SS28]